MASTLTGARHGIRRAVLLARLAYHSATSHAPPPPPLVRSAVRACSPVRFTGGRDEWDEYAACVAIELDIEEGRIGWDAIDPELTCGNRTEIAREIARERSAEALAVLTGRTT